MASDPSEPGTASQNIKLIKVGQRVCQNTLQADLRCEATLISAQHHSCQLRMVRVLSAYAAADIRLGLEETLRALIRTRGAAQAQSVTPATNRTGAAQDIRRFHPQPFVGIPR
jgi:hypothetical protein